MLRIFKPVKIQRLRPGLNPQTWVPEASMLTTRPPKPSSHDGKFLLPCVNGFYSRRVSKDTFARSIFLVPLPT